MTTTGILYILLGIAAFLVLALIFIYNNLIRKLNRAKEAWADIDVQLKRRHDLIPNLVEAVKGYAGHEKNVLEEVVKARSAAMGAGTPADKLKAEDALSKTLKTIFALAENYPQLRASENFMGLQDELTDTEDKIQAARRFYNANVRDYNTALAVFPSNLVASVFRYKPYPLFEAAAGEKEAVAVKF